jgi:hypothetical protein
MQFIQKFQYLRIYVTYFEISTYIVRILGLESTYLLLADLIGVEIVFFRKEEVVTNFLCIRCFLQVDHDFVHELSSLLA